MNTGEGSLAECGTLKLLTKGSAATHQFSDSGLQNQTPLVYVYISAHLIFEFISYCDNDVKRSLTRNSDALCSSF